MLHEFIQQTLTKGFLCLESSIILETKDSVQNKLDISPVNTEPTEDISWDKLYINKCLN